MRVKAKISRRVKRELKKGYHYYISYAARLKEDGLFKFGHFCVSSGWPLDAVRIEEIYKHLKQIDNADTVIILQIFPIAPPDLDDLERAIEDTLNEENEDETNETGSEVPD